MMLNSLICNATLSRLMPLGAVVLGVNNINFLQQRRQFFGKGWDNAALDTVYKCLIRKPEIQERLRTEYVTYMDGRDADTLRRMGDIAKDNNSQLRIYLAPHLGDPHRLLKCYSLTAYPIFSADGGQMMVEIDGHSYGAFADPDDDYSKVVIPQLDEVRFIAQELLTAMEWDASPSGAASFLESLYRGSEIPDHVFQTPAVIEHIPVKEGTPAPEAGVRSKIGYNDIYRP